MKIEQGFNERTIDKLLFDISGQFLRQLVADKNRGRTLVRQLAFAIGRTLDMNTCVLWRPQSEGSGQVGARWSVEEGEDATDLSAQAIKGIIQPFRKILVRTRMMVYEDLAFQQPRIGNVELLLIAAWNAGALKAAESPYQLWVFLESEKESFVLNHLLGWSILYRLLFGYIEERDLRQSAERETLRAKQAVLEVQRAAKIERLSLAADRFQDVLQSATPLLSQGIDTPVEIAQDALRADRNLLEALILRLLDSSWDEAAPGKAPELLAALKKLDSRLPQHDPKIRPLSRILRCWLEPHADLPPFEDSPRDRASADRIARDWIARWIWYRRHSQEAEANGSWERWLPHAVTDLSHLLKRWSIRRQDQEELPEGAWQPGPMGARFISLWLRLWFCQDLLRRELSGEGFLKRPLSQSQRRRYRKDLACVVLETLLALILGHRRDYRSRPDRVATALRTLVEHHAMGVAQFPADVDVRDLLENIRRAHPLGGREFSTGYLHHVFEVYITGQFLSTLLVQPATGEQTTTNGSLQELRARLAGGHTGRALAANGFTRAFNLAALLHNVGRLLFPWWSRQAEKLGNPDRGLREPLRQIGITLAHAASEFAEHCRRELMEGGYFEVFEQKAIGEWLEDKKHTASEADSALLGAWYVHRVASGTDLANEVRRQAVRAVLLARVVTLKINLEADPVAALLVVCDELFAWNPRPVAARAMEAWRWLHERQASSLTTRFESIDLPELHFRIDRIKESGRPPYETLVGILDEPPYLLPSFAIEVADPDEVLDGNVYGVWLGLQQNLGRIEVNSSPATQTEPWIKVRSRVPRQLDGCGLTCRVLLEEVAHRASSKLRTSLEAWLKEWEPRRENDYEECWIKTLKAQEKPFAREEPTAWIEELERLTKDVILNHQAVAAQRLGSSANCGSKSATSNARRKAVSRSQFKGA